MKIGLAGSSGHTNYVLEALRSHSDISVVAVSPGAPDESIADLLGALDTMGQWPQVFETAEEMIKAPGMDMIAVAAPFYRNAALTLQALARDLPVFCEKPLALTLEGLQELKEKQAQVGRPICAMLGMRCEPHFVAAKRAMLEGGIGTPLLVSGQKSYILSARPSFYSERATYGGTIPWVGIHAIDWCHWLTGQRFTDVTARQHRLHNGGNGTMESAASMLFTLQGGASATMHVDYLRPPTSLTHGDDRMRIAGDKGVLEIRGGHTYLMADTMLPQDIELRPTPGILHAFVEHLAGRAQNPVPTEDGFYATAASLLAREAADTGKTIKFSDYGW